MLAVTATSMCVTPILLIIHEKIISKKINFLNNPSQFNILDSERPQKKIIIVGFGHFGSTVGRLLRANKISATVLDHDSDRVKLLRSYGFKVFYGDATRIQTLRAAGIDEAQLLVLCMDEPEDNKRIAEMVREQYPEIKIFVRAKNRNDAYYYINHGIENIYRETLGTAVNMAVDILHETGMRKYAARRLAKRFTLIDKNSVKKLAKSANSEGEFRFSFKEAMQREEELLAFDNMNFESHDWIDDDDDDDDLTNKGT